MAYIGTAPSRSPLSSTQLDADLTLTDSLTITGSTPTVTIGDAGAEDSKLVFDGNAQDYHVGLDDTDDDLVIGVGSTLGTTTAVSVDENAKVKIDVGMLGPLYIGDTANTFNTAGLTINQGAADDEALALKSSDVAMGITGVAEADTFFTVGKRNATLGGAHVSAYAEDSSSISEVLTLNARGGQANTSKATNSQGLIVAHAREISGSGDADVAADGNVFGVVAERSGRKLVFIVDEDGDIHNDGADSAAYDAYDDAALLRGLELWRGDENEKTVKPQLLASRFDGNRYTKEQLEGAKVIQVQTKEEWDKGVRSLINTSTQSRVTTGAIWQNHEMLDAIITTLEKENSGFTAKLKKEFVARGLPTQILDWTGDIPDDLVKPDVAPKAFNAE